MRQWCSLSVAMIKEANFAEFGQASLLFDEFSGLKDCGQTAEGKGDYFSPMTEVFAEDFGKRCQCTGNMDFLSATRTLKQSLMVNLQMGAISQGFLRTGGQLVNFRQHLGV